MLDNVGAFVVKAHSVLDALFANEAKKSRLFVAALRSRRKGAKIDVSEAKSGQRRDHRGVFVEATRDTYGVIEAEIPYLLS